MLEEYPWRKLISNLAEMKFAGLLLRRDPGVDRSGPRTEVFQGNVQGVSGTLTRHP